MSRKNYIAPDKNKKSFTCPHCNTLAQMNFRQDAFEADMDKDGRYIESSILHIARCQCCGKKVIWIGDEYVYPDIAADEASSYMPKSVKQLYDEAGSIYNKSPRAACALLRLAIERLCHELHETDKDISKNIAALVKKGLSIEIQQALDIVRVVGNKAVHPGEISIDVEDKQTAIMLMQLLNMICERMIGEPQQINETYQNLPESVRNSINNRDK